MRFPLNRAPLKSRFITGPSSPLGVYGVTPVLIRYCSGIAPVLFPWGTLPMGTIRSNTGAIP